MGERFGPLGSESVFARSGAGPPTRGEGSGDAATSVICARAPLPRPARASSRPAVVCRCRLPLVPPPAAWAEHAWTSGACRGATGWPCGCSGRCGSTWAPAAAAPQPTSCQPSRSSAPGGRWAVYGRSAAATTPAAAAAVRAVAAGARGPTPGARARARPCSRRSRSCAAATLPIGRLATSCCTGRAPGSCTASAAPQRCCM